MSGARGERNLIHQTGKTMCLSLKAKQIRKSIGTRLYGAARKTSFSPLLSNLLSESNEEASCLESTLGAPHHAFIAVHLSHRLSWTALKSCYSRSVKKSPELGNYVTKIDPMPRRLYKLAEPTSCQRLYCHCSEPH